MLAYSYNVTARYRRMRARKNEKEIKMLVFTLAPGPSSIQLTRGVY